MRPASWLSCVVLLAACSGADESGPSAPCASSPRGIPACLAQAICGFQVRCGGLLVADEEACVARLASTYERQARRLAALVERGTARFDPEVFDACLERFGEFSCVGSWLDQQLAEPDCLLAVRGTKADAESCTDIAECAGGVCTGVGCGAVCGRLPAEGEACEEPVGSCSPGLHCDPLSWTCRRLASELEPCGGGRRCGPGLACVPDLDGTARCQTPLADGEPCTFPEGTPCEHGCRIPSGETDGVCGSLLAEGDACTLPGEGISSNRCGAGLVCWADQGGERGTCRVEPGDGDACTSDGPSCRWPYRCLAAGQTCGLGPAIGEACVAVIDGSPTPDYCGEGACKGGRCEDAGAPVPAGGACTDNGDCEAGLACKLEHCRVCSE